MTPSSASQRSLRQRLEAIPRCHLSHLPTPLEPLEKLSAQYGVNLFIKREDQTGLAFGGNKARKLDLLMADVLAQRAQSVISWAGVQSNWARQLAAASSKLGLHPILLLFTRPRLPRALDGNLLLDVICGAETHVLELESCRKLMSFESVKDLLNPLVEKESAAGRKPYIAPIGASLTEASMRQPFGALAYVNGFLELMDQMAARNAKMDAVVLATGSGSTHAGLHVGAQLFSPDTKIIGITVSDTRDDMLRLTSSIAQQTCSALAAGEGKLEIENGGLIIFDQYMGEGYAIPDQPTIDAIGLMAQNEGIVLDPVYTGRAFYGLLDLLKKGYFARGQNVVFIHTGGTPAVFAYREDFRRHLPTTSGQLPGT
jgi:D-cysteine desulfhydrase family pyridoxal phosphate-dependent enzyme